MPIDISFRAAINTLAELASDSYPPYVRVNAAARLLEILSPANPNYHDIHQDLDGDEDDEASSAEDDDPL